MLLRPRFCINLPAAVRRPLPVTWVCLPDGLPVHGSLSLPSPPAQRREESGGHVSQAEPAPLGRRLLLDKLSLLRNKLCLLGNKLTGLGKLSLELSTLTYNGHFIFTMNWDSNGVGRADFGVDNWKVASFFKLFKLRPYNFFTLEWDQVLCWHKLISLIIYIQSLFTWNWENWFGYWPCTSCCPVCTNCCPLWINCWPLFTNCCPFWNTWLFPVMSDDFRQNRCCHNFLWLILTNFS